MILSVPPKRPPSLSDLILLLRIASLMSSLKRKANLALRSSFMKASQWLQRAKFSLKSAQIVHSALLVRFDTTQDCFLDVSLEKGG